MNKWVWDFLESLTLDEPKPTQWFVDAIKNHWESIKTDERLIANRYWECTPSGVAPILRQAGYRKVGHDNASNQSVWLKQSS